MPLNRDAPSRSRQTQEFKNSVGELELLCRAMYAYMNQQGNFNSEKFQSILISIDEQDGVRDGKVTRSPTRKRKSS